MPVTAHEAEEATKAMMLKDLRIECRARGISPAGGREQLLQRVREHMVETGDSTIKSAGAAAEDSSAIEDGAAAAAPITTGVRNNNYARPEGQNRSNFITDKPTSRVLAAPGGGSSICFGDDSSSAKPAAAAAGSNKLASPAGKVPSPAPKTSSSPAKIAAAAGGNAGSSPGKIAIAPGAAATAANVESSGPTGYAKNNYVRPDGQNVGNFISGRNSSRVLAPPGGGSSIKFG